MGTRDIYFKRHLAYERNIQKLKDSQIDEETKNLIFRWHNHLFTRNAKQLRVAKLTYQMMKVCELVNSPLAKLVVADLELLGSKITQNMNWSDETKKDYRRCIKQFYFWYEDIDPRESVSDVESKQFYKYLKKNLSIKKTPKEINPSDIITESDLNIVLSKGCDNSRDRAFISALHESGCRIGELLNLKLKDISSDFSKIYVDGKTGKRSVPLKIISPAYIQKWIMDHPTKDDSNSYLWIKLSNNKRFEPLNYVGAVKIVKRAFSKAKVKKKHNVHWFRHSRATINAEFMTESMMCLYFGWSIGSKQVATYTHASSSQVDDVLNRHYGLEKGKNANEPIRCNKCMNMNISESQFCARCGSPLNSQASHKKEEYENNAFDLLSQIMQDDKLRDKFIKFNENINEGQNEK